MEVEIVAAKVVLASLSSIKMPSSSSSPSFLLLASCCCCLDVDEMAVLLI